MTTQHSHPAKPFGALVAPGDCPRCDEIREERAAEGIVDHNHESLPFGRRKPQGECPRCDELAAGAKPREGHTSRAERARRDDERRLADLRAHFASTRHQSGGCGVCTYGEW